MSKKRKNVPVMSYDATDRLFNKSVEEARDMVARFVAYVVTENPLVIALANKPKNHRTQIDIQSLRPDLSVAMPPSVSFGLAVGDPRCAEIVKGWRKP
jgi:hypothetical protein